MGNLALTINGAPVNGREGMTILEVARENGIDIPTLCYLEDLTPVGACRICVVEVEGSRTLVGSCHTPITQGMVINTHSPKVLEARKVIVELLLASHPDSCLVCDQANLCELRKIAADLEIGVVKTLVHPAIRRGEQDGNIPALTDADVALLLSRAERHSGGSRIIVLAYQ